MSDKNLEQLQKAILLKRMQKQMKAQPAATAVERIPQADRSQPLPLSHAQQRLWFLDQLDAAAGAAYHLPAGLRLQGRLERDALRRTLDRVLARHESLRTTFGSAQGRPVQRIAVPSPMALAEDNLRHLHGAEQEAALARIAAAEAAARFDLAQGPLIRARLVQLDEEAHVLLVTQHHIVSDGWSTGVLVREVAALYSAFCEGRPDPLPPLPLQYADYAAWQRSWLDEDTLARQAGFWRSHLQGAPALLELPADRTRPAQQSYAGGQVQLALEPELSASLRALAQRHGATLFMALLAGWSVLLSRLSGQDDVVSGTPVANRQRSDIEGLIGFFVNTLAIRVRLGERPTVAGLLAQVKASTLDAYAHQDLPFDHVVEALQPARSMAYAPLFQVMLSLNNTPAGGALQLPGLVATPYAQAASTTQFDLNLALHDDGNCIGGTLTYASDLFDAASAERLLVQLRTVLAAMAADDAQPVHALPLMDAVQQAEVAAFSARQGSHEADDLLHQLFERQAAMRPDAVAVSYGDQHLSYRALNERANRIAHALLAQGVQPDDRVAVCLERSTDMVAALLGVLKAGAGYVPLDPAYPADRLAYTLGDCLPAALLTTAALADKLPMAGLPLLALDDAGCAAALAAQLAHNPIVPGLQPGHLAYVIYTSGSTGMPKGVMVEHRNVVRLMSATEHWFGFDADDTWTLFHSFAFDFSVWEMWGALLYGGRLVVVPYLASRSPQDFYQLLCREGVTVLNQTPSAFRQLIAAQGEDGAPHRLRCVVFGGEALETATLQPWYARPQNAATQLVNMYGITETTVHVTYRALSVEDALRGSGSPIGRAIPDLEVHILDALGQPVPVGVTGEMYVGGAGVARGYLNRQELTAQRFINYPNDKHPEQRLYRSGDLARWLPDGGIEYLGRNDFQVKIRGFRIELGEIENRLAACGGVREAVVLAREDSPGDKRLVAYVVPQDGCAPDPAALRSELARTLAEHMLPSAFVLLDALPLTTNGKLDRKLLPAPAAGAVAAHAYQAPSTALEQLLCTAWAEVLGLPRVGVQDNYFDIGGDSIRSIAIVADVRERGVEMAIVDLFKHPTVAGLAAVLAERQGGAADDGGAAALLAPEDAARLPQGVEDAYPLTMLQLGMVYHNALEQDAGVYHDVSSHCLQLPRWDEGAMRRVLAALGRKHPVLRTAFDLDSFSEPLQLVYAADAAAVPLLVEDLRQLDRAAQDAAIAAFVDGERGTAFDLGAAPLLRVFIHVRAADSVQFTLSFHHAILDGWSLAALQTELVQAYLAAIAGGAGALQLAPLSLSPRLAVEGERRALDSAAHRGFWQAYLDDYAYSALPAAQGEGGPVVSGRCRRVQVDGATSARLQALATELGVPMRTVLLCAHMRLMAALSGNRDVTTGLVSNVRPERKDGDKLLGLFLNTLPFRQKLEAMSWKELVAATYRNELDVLAHRDYPYARLHQDNGRRPYYEVMFNYINFHVYGQLGSVVQDSGHAEMFEATSHALEIDCSYSPEQGVRFEVDARELSLAQVERIAGYYSAILSAMASAPDSLHTAMCPLDPLELEQVLHGFNGTAADYPRERMIHELFEAQAQVTPAAPALVWEGRQVSYRELDEQANRLAHRLLALGLQPDQRVALCIERSVEMVAGMLAILKAGGAYVPLDPEYPSERLAYMLADSAPVALLTQAGLAERVPAGGIPVLVLDSAAQRTALAAYPAHAPQAAATGLADHHMAYVLYTSGSTGAPKGVMVEHRNVRNLVQHHISLCGLTAADRVLQFASFGFDNSIAEIFPALAVGARIVLRPPHLVVPDREFAEFLARHQVTMTDLPTAFWHLWAGEVKHGRSLPPPSLRVVLAGGEKAEKRHLESWFSADGMDSVRWINTYGPTEAAVNATTIAYRRADALPAGDIPIGRPLANTVIRILDHFGQPCPVGVAGEIHIGGVQVARGYLNRAELSAERFVADPFSSAPGARLYKTGDLGRWNPDGSIDYMGRNDFQVKIRGFRIEIGEIEARLAACPGVREAVVLAREDQPGDKRLVAYLLAQPGSTLTAAELRRQLADKLADYMVPSAFVVLDAFPLNPNKKLDRKALPAPGVEDVITRDYEAPLGALELAVAEVWQELLGVDRIGRDDHFFELGGHSLLVVSLIEQLRRRGLAADVRSVFRAPTVRGMAALIGDAAAAGGAAAGAVPDNLIPPGCSAITPDMLPLVQLAQDEIDAIAARIPGGAANIQDIYPLAPLQQGILFHHLLEGEGDPYLLRMALSFDSRARLDAFLGAVQAVFARHDVLRTAVLWHGLRAPVQVVCREAALPVEELHFEGDVFAQLMERIDPRRMRLDLGRAPLFAAWIAHDQASGEWHLALLNHHLVSDHITMDFIIAEVQAHLQGHGEALAPSIPYRNFIARTLEADPARQEAYFRTVLGDIDEPTAPFGLLDVRGDGAQVQQAELALDDAMAARLRELARQHGVTPAVLFHAAWAQVLGACTGRDDVVFGTVLLGRMQGSAGADQVLGLFMNTLPVRVSLAGASVRQAVAETYRQLSELLAHEQAPLAEAQRCSGVAAPLPLFTSLLNYRHSHAKDEAAQAAAQQAWQGVRAHTYEERINYPIGMSVNDFGLGFSLTAQCAGEGVDPQRMAAMLAQAVAGLLDALEQAPDTPLRGIGVLPPAERALLLQGFNATGAAWNGPQLVHQLFEQQAAAQPGAVAVVAADATLDYGALNAQANRIAHHLLALGVQPGDRVALCVERSSAMVAALLGILKAGAAYVPLDPAFPGERLAYMLADCAPAALVTEAALSDSLDAPGVARLLLDAQAAALAKQPDVNLALDLPSSQLAYVIYTSGSTGLPKGVMVEHGSVSNFLASMAREPGLKAYDALLAVTTLSFDIAGLELYLPLAVGARVVLASRATASDAAALAQAIDTQGISVMQATPATWRMLLASGWQGARGLKVLCGGEALPADLSAQLRAVVGELWNVYGPTETTIWSTSRRVDGSCSGVAEPIGRPIANTQVYVLDAQLQPVPLGAAGELFIAGFGVARGYLERAELTAERFVRDPFSSDPEARMYKTGDLARWRADGQLEYLGRNDFQVKVRGFRIELGEIETRLAACAGVHQAVVAAREDVPGDQRLVAYLVAEEGVTLDMGALRAELLAQLPEYMVPSAFVQLDAFPLTPNNKLDRKALPAPGAEAVIQRAYEAPQGAAEEAIAAVWQELLGVERVGRRDQFFELGGHSLLAVQAVGRMRAALGVEVPLRALFDRPALADFAALLPAVQRAVQPAIAATDRSLPLPLSFPQQRLWFLDQLNHAASAAYHMPAALRLQGRLDQAALRAALDRIVARHEVLRTSFVQADGEASQVVAGAASFALAELDLSHLSGHEQRHALSLVALEEQAKPFDMAQGPLIRGQLVRLADDEHMLYVTQHHIISDAWSVGLLVREASALYAAFSQGQPDPLPPLALHYADYAAWQRGQLHGAALEAQTGYWREQLAGAPALLELPADHARPAVQQYEGGRLHFSVPAATADGLRALGQRHGATLFMTLFAGWSALLARLSGQDDVVVGTPVANRPRSELEPLIGFFVNTLALRVRLDGDPTVAGLLARVRAATLGAWEHQDLPFEQLVDAVQPARSMSYSPLFQVLFSMDNTPAEAALELPGLRIDAVEQAGTGTQFDLVLAMSEGADGLAGSLTYASALFERATAERFVGHFLALLEGMLADEQARLSALPLLTAAQREQLLEEFNATDAAFPAGQLAHQLFEAQAAARPEALALLFGEHKLSYGQLNRRANQVAQRLLQLGVRPDDRVALCVERGLEMIIGLLGILKAGGAYVPLDPAYPAERLAYMLEDSAPKALVTLGRLASRPAAGGLAQLLLDEEAAALAALPDADLAPQAIGLAPQHLAYVIYTSGSTGKPKGVMNEHAGLCNLVHAQAAHYGVTPDSRVLQFVSVSFDVCISEVTMALCQGAALVLATNADLMPGEPLLATLRRHRVTHASMPTAVLGTLPFDADLGAVHTLIVGGEAMPPALAEHWSARATLFNAYGPTEAAVCTALHRCAGAQGAAVPIGRPTANTRMYVLDAAGQPVPLGVAGELHIGGAQVARGYLHRPELTAQRFVPDLFSGVPGARLYKTGDLVRWQPDGTLLYLGRNDFQVKLRGFRIELGEIEARLAACDGVREALVLCREDSPGDKRLVAYVVPHEGAAPAVAALRAGLADSLAEHMLPSAYVLLDALPLTANGKVDRAALPLPAGRSAGAEYVAPRNATEEALCRVWSTLLQLERIGINGNFFESGGHSLLLVKLHAELGRLYPQRLALSDYFKYTTVAALAAFLEQEAAAPAAGLAADAGAARAAARRAAQQGSRGRRALQ